MLNVVSVRVGAKYGPEYVAILHNMVARNLSNEDHTHWCVTDDPASLPDGVNPIPHNPDLPGWWQKVGLFSPAMPWTLGDRVLFLDLDVCVTGRLEDMPKGIVRDWLWPTYNSSVMCWDHGEHAAIWTDFRPEIMARAPGPLVGPECLPKGQANGGDQEWITEASQWPTFPAPLCVSYKLHAQDWPPNGSAVVCFHGATKPADVATGWVPDVWKVNGFTSLPELKGMNVSHETLYENVRASAQRDLSWFTGFKEREQVAVIVCGGPSMRECLEDIKAQRRRGARIVSVNNALRYLTENGVTPDVHVMLDARPENAAFVTDAPAKTRYLIASQCHPDVFDALEGREVVLWHNAIGDCAELREIMQPWWEGPNAKPICMVPGGGTVGLRALWLCEMSGYRKIHVYGMDSCYHDDAHHAYPQALNDGEDTLQVSMNGKLYRCARWMARQASEFQDTWHDLARQGVSIWVHGRGLVPDMARALRMERAA